jgi:hypothetical protein
MNIQVKRTGIRVAALAILGGALLAVDASAAERP